MKRFKVGKYINQGYYKSFQPENINRDWHIDDMQLLNLLSKADRYLGRLDMYSEYVPIDLYIRMHITKEATQSSKIEGTQTNMEQAFLDKEEIVRVYNLEHTSKNANGCSATVIIKIYYLTISAAVHFYLALI